MRKKTLYEQASQSDKQLSASTAIYAIFIKCYNKGYDAGIFLSFGSDQNMMAICLYYTVTFLRLIFFLVLKLFGASFTWM